MGYSHLSDHMRIVSDYYRTDFLNPFKSGD